MSRTVEVSEEVGAIDSWPVRRGDLVINKYLVEGELGSGGMGVVVAARDTLLDRRVAIKFLRRRLLAVEIAPKRFIREARAATRITSEHGVKVLEVGTLADGLPFLVMEYLEGSDLGTLLRDRGPLAAKQAVDFLLQALQAIAEAHAKGIVHRDIKPSNLFLTHRVDGTPLVKVLDFGIAKTLDYDAPSLGTLTTSEDTRLGSLLYMSPEQLTDARSVDHRSDIWALGVTLYELLCGKSPFSSPSQFDAMSQILNGSPESMRTKCPGTRIPIELESVVMMCLERERERRVENALALAVRLAPFGSEDAQFSVARIQRLAARDSSRAAPVTHFGYSGNKQTQKIRPSSRRRVFIVLVGSAMVIGLAAIAMLQRDTQTLGEKVTTNETAYQTRSAAVLPGASGAIRQPKTVSIPMALSSNRSAPIGGPVVRPSVPEMNPAAGAKRLDLKSRPAKMVDRRPPESSAGSVAEPARKRSETAPNTIETLFETRR